VHTRLLASLCCGLFLAPYCDLPGWWPVLPTALALVGVCNRRSRIMPWIVCLLLATVAPLLYQNALHPASGEGDLRQLADGSRHTLSGRILRSSHNESGRWTFDLDRVKLLDGPPRAMQGRLRLYVGHLEQAPSPGARLQFRTRLRVPRNFGLPGEFNYARYLASRDLRVTGYLHEGANLHEQLAQPGFIPALARLRSDCGAWLENNILSPRADLLKALLLGDRSSFPRSLRDRVSRAGLSHLLAISGLHLGLLAWLLYSVGFYLYCRSTRLLLWQPPARILPVLLIFPLSLYALFTGGALSTWRALLMFSIAALLLLRCERQRPLDLLQLVLFILLLLQPLTLFDPGLQLSAAGVAGILLFLPHWKKLSEGLPGWLRKICEIPLATLAATLATLPLVGLHFHQLAPAGIVSNLFAIPLVGFAALPAGLAGILGHLLHIPGSILPVRLSGWLLAIAVDLGDKTSRLPFLSPVPWYPAPWQLAACLFTLLAILFLARRYWQTGLVLLTVSAMLFAPAFASSREELSLIAFATGQGEALLLTRPDGTRTLVDGGGLRSNTFDVGERLLAPALGWLGIRHLDTVIMTHPHPDHFRGLAAILRNFQVDRFVSALPEDELPAEIRASLTKQTEVLTLDSGWQQLDIGARLPLRIWVPDQQTGSTNDHSLAIYERFGDDGLLLTGDLEDRGVRNLLSALPEQQPVSLLKLPHHGSRYSAPDELIKATAPRLALVSAGYRNSYHLPSKEVLELCRAAGVTVMRTDLQQTIRCRSTGHGWQPEFWNRGWFRSSPVAASEKIAGP